MNWCPDAVRLDGPEAKTGYDGVQKTHAKVGVVLHTMEYESTPEWNDAKTLYNALFSTREASWTFSICKFMNGAILFQHYPLDAVCWAQGKQGNLWLIGIETEGIAPGKFTEAQYELLVKLLKWIKEAQGWIKWDGIGDRDFVLELAAQDRSTWLFEHNAVPGAPATNCAVFTHQQVDASRLLNDLQGGDMTLSQTDENWVKATIADMIKKAGPKLLRISDQDEIMELRADGLFHIDGETYLRLGYDKLPVEVVAKDDPILKRRVIYPAGVPAEMH